MKFLIVLFATVSLIAAKEGEKSKRDLFIATRTLPYTTPYIDARAVAPAVAYAAPAVAPAAAFAAPAVAYPPYDDGQYYPGKYERPTFLPYSRGIYY